MKLYLLKEVAKRWREYKHISYINRIFDNELLICFDKKYFYRIDLTKSNSNIYYVDNYESSKKSSKHKAPFDMMLLSKFQSSDIVDIQAFDNDRILKIIICQKLSYKRVNSILQLEFTGKNTNAIILNEKNIIQEALRHIDNRVSFRAVKPGISLLSLKAIDIKEDIQKIEDIDKFLQQIYINNITKKIDIARSQALDRINKKISVVKDLQNSLESSTKIQENIKLWSKKANIILCNIDKIDIYKASIIIDEVCIDIPSTCNSSYELSDYCFKKSKKSKAILENIHIQKDNIEQKLLFLDRHKELIQNTNNLEKLIFLSPNKSKISKKPFCEEFIFDGFKIMVGRNSNENAKILKMSKKDDLWMHLRDIPSSHVLIISKRQQFPQAVIQKSANLCVDMSVSHLGKYTVDYTKRGYVRVQKGSNVLYTHQKSIVVSKEILSIQ
jgi:predicted ribosome quality control (RQC) complex YloA/Tae2 family protein